MKRTTITTATVGSGIGRPGAATTLISSGQNTEIAHGGAGPFESNNDASAFGKDYDNTRQ